MWRSTGPEDNENTLATGSSSNSIAKPPPVKPPPTLPTLSLDRPEEAAGPFCLDFGQVPLGQSKALPFAVAGASGRLEVERQPSDVQVTLSPRSGVVLWTPTAVAAGAMREAIVLLHAEQRVQIVVQGQAVSPESGASDARQPLRPAASNVNIGRASSLSLQQQQRPFLPAKATSSAGKFAGAAAFLYATEPLRASIAEDNCDMRAPPALPLPTPQRGRAAWEIGVEPFTPSSNKRRLRPPMNVLATPGPPMLPAAAATAAKPPATSVIKAKGARLGLPAASPRQERVLVEWLNHTLILPTPAQSLPHPAEFLKMQDDATKAQVQAMYESTEFERLRDAIQKEIARSRLQLRDDRDLFADLILRDAFVELLLSYQLPWLQLGLEVVLGVEVHKARLATGRDGQLVRLSTLTTLKNLIAQRMLADPGISQRFGTTGTRLVQGRAREAMLQELRAHLLERFLCLVALLDHAKHLEVLPRRRPLFRPSAAVKSSADVLIEFAKALLAGEGNLAKHLASLGYRVGHKQTYLEEFDFRATQLSRDLRDGVRLARLVDTLEPTTAPTVCSQLRVPAISRLQKVHNCKVSLAALGRAGLQLPFRLTPDDIVDGHVEKALGLLYAVARHYKQEELLASLPGVTRLQALARGSIVRRRFLRLRGLALGLQRLFRARRVLLRCRRFPVPAVIAIQAQWRGIRGRRAAAALREARAHAAIHARVAAATTIQAQARALLARRRFVALCAAALTAQRLFRGQQARRELRRLVSIHRAVTRLQSQWRSHRQQRVYLKLRAATIVVQAQMRRRLAMQQRRRMLAAALVLGRAVRRWRVRRHKQAVQASMVMQATWRGHRVRRLVTAWRAAAVTLQARYRRHKAQQRFHRLQAAARTVQALVRGHRVRQEHRRCHAAAATIQRQWSGYQARYVFRAHVGAIITVQALVRGWAARRRFHAALAAVRLLQRWCRGQRCRKALQQEQAAATHIQAAWRGKQARVAVGRALKAVIRLQATARGRQIRSETRKQWRALAVLQRAARRFVAQVRANRAKAASLLQAVWRGHAVRRQLQQATAAAFCLQAAWRMAAARRHFFKTRAAAVVVQRWVRAVQERARFTQFVVAAVAVQRIWRGWRARVYYRAQHKAALVVQTAWRAFACRRRFLQQRTAALHIQATVRRCAAVRRYQRCLRGVRALQQRARRRRLERALQAHCAAAIKAQSLWRGHQVRARLAREHSAAIRLQAYARGVVARARARRFRQAVARLQACLRGWRVRRVQGLKLRMLRARVREANARAIADPSLQIGFRHAAALDVLGASKSCAHILKCCKTLEVSTSLARECCEALVGVDGVPKLLAVVRSLNRSQPHILCLRHILSILAHVAAHPLLLPALAEEPGAVETLAVLLQTYRSTDHTFLPAAALLLRACRAGARARADLQQPAVWRKLQGSLRLLERKAEVELKSSGKARVLQGKGKPEASVAAPIRALRRVLELGGHG